MSTYFGDKFYNIAFSQIIVRKTVSLDIRLTDFARIMPHNNSLITLIRLLVSPPPWHFFLLHTACSTSIFKGFIGRYKRCYINDVSYFRRL